MTAQTTEIPAELLCDWCGYDLRAHPPDGKCPECGASVAESRRLAANPRRPAWRDSDPRWRRRMLVGIWMLVLLPLMNLLIQVGWASRVTVPNVFRFPGTFQLNESFLSIRNGNVYPSLVFCIGIVLLFSKERGRRRNRLDWTRRWGVICSYVIFLLSAVPILFISALVMVGIAALFLSMPPKYQPGVTQFFVEVSTAYLRHGPYPTTISVVVLAAFSSIVILLACVPLLGALRSSGAKHAAPILVAPLALFALFHLGQATWYCINFSSLASSEIDRYQVFFWPEMLVGEIAGFPVYSIPSGASLNAFFIEAAKWCAVLGIAVWLSIAQFGAWRRHRKSSAKLTPLAAGIG